MLVKHVGQTRWSNMLVKHVGQKCWSNTLVKHIAQTCWLKMIKYCWTQHVGPVWTAHSNMLDSVGRCWKMLDEVWLYSNFSSNIVQHFRSSDQKYAIISSLVLKSNTVGWCWIRFPALNTIQHWSNNVQDHLTILDVWPKCLIRLKGPWVVRSLTSSPHRVADILFSERSINKISLLYTFNANEQLVI